jgi:predicted DNA-binding transcriptional regulator AlpA
MRQKWEAQVRAMKEHTKSWLTIKEAVEATGVSRASLYRYWALKLGPRFSTTPGGSRRIRADWLDDWLLDREVVS